MEMMEIFVCLSDVLTALPPMDIITVMVKASTIPVT